jgi:hypothetical protein
MYKLRLAAIATFSVIISACSSVPEISDIEPALAELWAPCTYVKIKNMKKTNGIANGEKYTIAYSYDVEVTRDVRASSKLERPSLFDALGEECPVAYPIVGSYIGGQFISLLKKAAWDSGIYTGQVIKAGDLIAKKDTKFTFNNTLPMVKSEKGWIID